MTFYAQVEDGGEAGRSFGRMSLGEAKAYLKRRGLNALVPGGANTIAKMQGIEKLKD